MVWKLHYQGKTDNKSPCYWTSEHPRFWYPFTIRYGGDSMKTYTEFHKKKKTAAETGGLQLLLAGVAGGGLCFWGIDALVFMETPLVGAVLILGWIIYMISGIRYFSC